MTETKDLPIVTREEVAKHNSSDDMWIIIENDVYDVTKFAQFHPGGLPILARFAGQECTDEFKSYHNEHVLARSKNMIVATLLNTQHTKASTPFPFAEPAWYGNAKSPFYKQTHIDFRNKVRAFVDKEIMPFCHQWDKDGTYPPELRTKAYEAGIYSSIYPKKFGGTPPEDFDAFHDLILVDELSRSACGGLLWSCFFSFGISIPPVIAALQQFERPSNFDLLNTIATEVLTGKKLMSLCVTEPGAGSDVSNMTTSATVVKDEQTGDEFWEISGEKRYITGGIKADYYTVLCTTDGGLTLILVERETKGVKTRRQVTQGWLASNTAFIQFNKVRVPRSHTIGKQGEGFKAVMHNFNHERFVFAVMANRMARVCLADAVQFARARSTFKQKLSKHQVIRHKIVEMSLAVERVHAYLEYIASQMKEGRINQIGGEIAMAKAMATDSLDFCAKEATQVLGGAAYMKLGGGPGERIERLYRECSVMRIAGGSREVLMNLVANQAKL